MDRYGAFSFVVGNQIQKPADNYLFKIDYSELNSSNWWMILAVLAVTLFAYFFTKYFIYVILRDKERKEALLNENK